LIDASDRCEGLLRQWIASAAKLDYDKAISDFTEAIRLDPNLALAYLDRGYAYSHYGNPDKAISDYNDAIRLDPHLALAYFNRGTAYQNQGNLDKAISGMLVGVDDPRRWMVLSAQPFTQKALGGDCIAFGSRARSRSLHPRNPRPGTSTPICLSPRRVRLVDPPSDRRARPARPAVPPRRGTKVKNAGIVPSPSVIAIFARKLAAIFLI
jgi:hypothetical protein